MNCLECRRLMYTHARTRSAGLAMHLRDCPACARLAASRDRFEKSLEAALRVPVPDRLPERVHFAARIQPERGRYRRTVAAAVALLTIGLIVFLGGWEYTTSRTLTRDIAGHMQTASADASHSSSGMPPRLAELTRRIGVYLASTGMGHIVSTRQTAIDGRMAAQLFVTNGTQRAQIFVLPDTRLVLSHNVRAASLPGRLIPVGDDVIGVFCPDRQMLVRFAADLPHSL